MTEEKVRFVVKKITNIEDLISGKEDFIPESDITFQTENKIIQLELREKEPVKEKYIIKPGVFIFQTVSSGIILSDIELKKNKMLETVSATKDILAEGDKFFSRLDIYQKRSLVPKRAIILMSPPGVGKTAAINLTCEKYVEKDPNTCVIVWDTSSIRSKDVLDFFMARSKFENVSRLIMVMEDIGGGSVDDYDGPRGVDASMLNLLDGVGNPFQMIPTFIIATTNHPEQIAEALIDRPGRFDKCLEIQPPKIEEVVELYKFFLQTSGLDSDTQKAAELAAGNSFSIAHISESITRADLDGISILESVESLISHRRRFRKAFSKIRGVSLGGI